MGLLLKFVIFGVAAYVAWTTARRWFGLLRGSDGNPPVSTSRRAPTSPPPGPESGPKPATVRRPVVEDTKACPVCGAYVSVNAGKCGRPDCPQS